MLTFVSPGGSLARVHVIHSKVIYVTCRFENLVSQEGFRVWLMGTAGEQLRMREGGNVRIYES